MGLWSWIKGSFGEKGVESPPASTWDHPELGCFKYDGAFWTRIVDVPAFKAFAYDTGFGKGPSKGKYELKFMADDETDLPSPAAIALALKVLANQVELVSTVK